MKNVGGFILAVWTLGGVYALFCTLSMTELGTAPPLAGEWYVYRFPRRFMKWLNCWFLLASLFVTGFCQAQSNSSVADQILPLLSEQLFAANAHDTDRFLATYVHSPELVFIANGQIIRGWDSLHDQQLKWWKNGKTVWFIRSTPSPKSPASIPRPFSSLNK